MQLKLKQRRQPRTSSRTRSPPSAPPRPGGVGDDSPLSLGGDQRAALRGVGLDPGQDKAAGTGADLGVLDQILSPFRSEPRTLIGLGLLGTYVLRTFARMLAAPNVVGSVSKQQIVQLGFALLRAES